MKKKYKILSLLLIALFSLSTFVSDINFAKASENLSGNGKWKGVISGSAKGTFTSSSPDSFTVDVDSIGTSEWDITVTLEGISLEKGKTYVYAPKITSSINRDKLFLEIKDKNGNLITENQETNTPMISKSIPNKLFYLINPKTDLDDVTIKYGLGYNNYEAGTTTQNAKDKITVEDALIYELKDFDYKSLSYKSLGNSSDGVYKNYYYNNLYQTDIPHADNKGSVQTVAYRSLLGNIIKHAGEDYNIYLNGVKTAPAAVDDNSWIHFKFSDLIYEYNVITAINNDGKESIMVIKNQNVTNYRTGIMSQINDYQKDENTETLNDVIDSYKEKLNNANSEQEMNKVLEDFKKAFSLQQKKDDALLIVDSYNTEEETSEKLKDIIDEYKNKINEATDETNIEEIVENFKGAYNLQTVKESALKSLKELVGKDYSDEVKDIYETALDDINNATNEEEIDDILNKAKEDIKTQLEKEKKEAEKKKEEAKIIPNNPLTYDNILIYFGILIVSIIGFKYFLKKSKN